jgi:hypothetical protein
MKKINVYGNKSVLFHRELHDLLFYNHTLELITVLEDLDSGANP